MTSPPNLFDYATKELSQDAVICWLIDWAGRETSGEPEDEKLRQCGLAFVKALFSKWRDWGYSVDLGDSVRTEVRRQEKGIDVLARVDGKHVLLIEDKTKTGAHDDQLARYGRLVVEGKTYFEDVDAKDVYPIYCKTGNHSLKDRQYAEDQEYAVFDRADFLEVLKDYSGTNGILIDFRRHLERWQEETASFIDWTKDGWEWTKDSDERSEKSPRAKHGWEGLYDYIEKKVLYESGDDWQPLGSLVGGYNCLSIELTETSKNSKFAIWIEENRISFRLYGAKGEGWVVCVDGQNREKDHWAKAFVEQGAEWLKRPRNLNATKTKPMCVAEWRGWLEFGDVGKLDLEGSVKHIGVAKEVLLRTIRRGSR